MKSTQPPKWSLRLYQVDMVEKIIQGFKSGHPFIAVGATACHGRDEKVLMYNGDIKKVQDVVVGDLLMGPDSTPREVLKLHRGREEMVEIKPHRWKSLKLTINHTLSLENTSTQRILNITIKDYLSSSNNIKHLYKLYRRPVEYPAAHQTIDPYILGLWLGDGNNNSPAITTPDQECIDAWVEYAKELGLDIRVACKDTTDCNTYYMTTHKTSGQKKYNRNKMTAMLRELDLLNNKHIPSNYLIASRAQRLALLAGLIDSDGSKDLSGYDYVTKYENLAEDIRTLSLSLGFGTKVVRYQKSSQNGFVGDYYRMHIGGDCTTIPVKVSRKVHTKHPTQHHYKRSGFNINKLGVQDYYGFTVTKDSLYLTDDFVVTHNCGKSLVIADVAAKLNTHVLVLCPSKEILQQNYAKMQAYGLDAAMYSASVGTKEIATITLATIGSIYKKPEEFKHFEYVMMDECFPAGTRVDGRPIEDIRPGDLVKSYNHSTNKIEHKRVRAISKRSMPEKMCTLRVNGVTIVSTLEHPYYIDGKGYVKAKDVTLNDKIYIDMQWLRERAPREQQAQVEVERIWGGKLLKSLQIQSTKRGSNPMFELYQNYKSGRMHPTSKDVSQEGSTSVLQSKVWKGKSRKTLVGTHEGIEPNVLRSYSEESIYYTEVDGAQAPHTRRERQRTNQISIKIMEIVRRWLVYRTHSKNTRESTHISYPLQNRYSKSITNDSDRGRWQISQHASKKGARQKEDQEVGIFRVESIEIHEPASDGRVRTSDEKYFVYNLEVEDNNNYFAEGVLVHNCHLYNAKGRDTMYRKLFQAIGTRKVCGLTATPYRLDQRYFGSTYTGCIKMLNRMTKDSFFREIVCKVEMEDLIEQNYLTRPQYHTFETDLSTLVVNTTGRDYTEASLKKWGSQRLDQFMHVVEQLDEKHKRILVFCTSVAQAEKGYRRLQERFNIKAGVVTGKMPKKQREALLKSFATGEVRWMFNVGCLTTGYDLPVLDAVVLLRPTFSVGLYVQMCGRSVRLDPDDPDKEAHIYDFTDTVKKFGRAEKIKVVKEDGFKDMLMGEHGRLDLKELFKFDTKSGKPLEIREKFDINKVNLLDLI